MKSVLVRFFIAAVIIMSTVTHSFSAEPEGQASTAQDATTDTEHLQHNKPFTIVYGTPSRGFGGKLVTQNELKIVLYEKPFGPPVEYLMEYMNGLWKTTFTINDTTVKMLVIAFRAADTVGAWPDLLVDNNNGEYWDLLIRDKSGNPVLGAHEARALSFTGYGDRRPERIDIALDEVLQELDLYPDNLTARTLYYTILLRKEKNTSYAFRRIRRDLDAMLRSRDDEEALRFVLNAYRMIDENDRALEIEQQLIQNNPRGENAAMKAFDNINEIEDAEERVQSLESFLLEFSATRFGEYALSSLAQTAIELDDSTRMISAGDRLLHAASPTAASGLAGIAGVLAEKGLELNRAYAYITKAIQIIETSRTGTRPPEISEEDWEDQILNTLGRYEDILGWVYYKNNNLDKALTHLESAAEAISQPGIYYHLAQVYRDQGESETALIQLARVAAFGGELGETAHTDFDELWIKSGRDTTFAEQVLFEQEDWIDQRYRKTILDKRRTRQAPDFELEAIDGGWVRLSDQEGELIVLCFWASWSRSSARMFNVLNRLSEEFGEEILILTVAMDDEFDDVDRFVRRNQIDLPVLLNDETDRDYQLQGVPTTYVIDRRGVIHFEHKGYRPDIGRALALELESIL